MVSFDCWINICVTMILFYKLDKQESAQLIFIVNLTQLVPLDTLLCFWMREMLKMQPAKPV
jgi:hypothetical protein